MHRHSTQHITTAHATTELHRLSFWMWMSGLLLPVAFAALHKKNLIHACIISILFTNPISHFVRFLRSGAKDRCM